MPEAGEHTGHDGAGIILRLPVPVVPGGAVVYAVGPAVGDGLAKIGLTVKGKTGELLADLGREFGGSEAGASNIIGRAGADVRGGAVIICRVALMASVMYIMGRQVSLWRKQV